MKLRFGWGPTDGAAGMQRNVDLVRTVRETVGDEIDVMADAYMGWTLDYAKRMLPLLEPFQSALAGRAGHSRRYPRLCRAEIVRREFPSPAGEHEFTLYGFRDLLEARARRLHPVRHQPRRRHHAGTQDRGAGRSAFRFR